MNSTVRIYLAAPWEAKPQAKEARETLREAGFVVDCRWIDLHTDVDTKHPDLDKFKAEQALNDVEDLINSDILILLNISKSEGKAVETGMALASGRPVILVGERTNIFHWLPITKVSNIQEAIDQIREWEAVYEKRSEEILRQLKEASVPIPGMVSE